MKSLERYTDEVKSLENAIEQNIPVLCERLSGGSDSADPKKIEMSTRATVQPFGVGRLQILTAISEILCFELPKFNELFIQHNILSIILVRKPTLSPPSPDAHR